MQYSIIIIVLVYLSGNQNQAENPKYQKEYLQEKVDTTVYQIFDYTGDAIIDTAILHIEGKDFYSPFSWEFKLLSGGENIFHKSGEDNNIIDSFYYDTDYVGKCFDYIDCKKEFYFNILGLKILDQNEGHSELADAMTDPNMGLLAYKFLKDSCKIENDDQINEIVNSLAREVESGRATLVMFLDHPIVAGPVMMYLKQYKIFVPLYDD